MTEETIKAPKLLPQEVTGRSAAGVWTELTELKNPDPNPVNSGKEASEFWTELTELRSALVNSVNSVEEVSGFWTGLTELSGIVLTA